jgi:hypothetical protein
MDMLMNCNHYKTQLDIPSSKQLKIFLTAIHDINEAKASSRQWIFHVEIEAKIHLVSILRSGHINLSAL